MSEGAVVDHGAVEGTVISSGDDQGYNLAPGETLVPGTTQTVESSEAASSEVPAPAEEATESSSDEAEGEVPPPAPVADPSTDA